MLETPRTSWRPDDETLRDANATALMRDQGIDAYEDLHRWSVEDRPAFWKQVLDCLGIVFAVPPEQIMIGTPREPSRLVVYAVPTPGPVIDPEIWRAEMQHEIRTELNPLFRIHEVVLVDALPRTASAKVMRRELGARHE